MEQAKIRVVLVAGARPNFMKIAPIIREFQKAEHLWDWKLVHTGQHYDRDMSDVFFEELGIPRPDFHMEGSGGSHAEQTARIMVAFERYCAQVAPHLVLVVGDVNSTLACSVVAKKFGSTVAHVEAGLRSRDMTMPEEINRIVTDAISDLFFVTEPSGVDNLLAEGHKPASIHYVGHVMIDNLYFQLEKLNMSGPICFGSNELKTRLGKYGVVTLHRPSNVDNSDVLTSIASTLAQIAEELPLVFPLHPRTKANIARFGIELSKKITCIDALPYMEFLNLWKDASVVLTDSGGVQEETTALGVPCVTLRENTERPITVTEGTNELTGTDSARILAAFRRKIQTGRRADSRKPQMWDGRAASRILDVLHHHYF